MVGTSAHAGVTPVRMPPPPLPNPSSRRCHGDSAATAARTYVSVGELLRQSADGRMDGRTEGPEARRLKAIEVPPSPPHQVTGESRRWINGHPEHSSSPGGGVVGGGGGGGQGVWGDSSVGIKPSGAAEAPVQPCGEMDVRWRRRKKEKKWN